MISKPTNSLEKMLSIIIEDNSIARLNLVFYDVVEFYDEIIHIPLLDECEEGVYEKREIGVSNLFDAMRNTGDGLIGLGSYVRLKDASPASLFFLDFTCPQSIENLNNVKTLVHDLGLLPGFILNSGRSYHFYHNGVITFEDWEKKLNEATFSDIVDYNWLYFQLGRGYSVLRISTNSIKQCLPTVIEAIGTHPLKSTQKYLFDM